MRAVVVLGTPATGFKVYGPFPSEEEAAAYRSGDSRFFLKTDAERLGVDPVTDSKIARLLVPTDRPGQ